MYKLVYFVPSSHLQDTKEALFKCGLGHSGNYEKACWQTLGTSQFCPLPNSKPQLGQIGETCIIEEYKVEMLCQKDLISKAVQTLRQTHPYENPAYEIIALVEAAKY